MSPAYWVVVGVITTVSCAALFGAALIYAAEYMDKR